jgi:acetyl esterase/lipase
MTVEMVKSLKPGGRLVFVEYRLEDPEVPIKLVHKMTERQVLKEMEIHPLKHVKTHNVLPRQHIIVFEKSPPKEKPEVLDVWPGKPPGETADVGVEGDTSKPDSGKVAGQPVIRLGNVSKPTITIHRPAKEIDTGVSVVICPGGGYNILAWDLEGEEVATWLNSLGVTGIVLKYRVPRRPDQPKDKPPIGPLQDAQRAVSLVRSKAKEWKLDPDRIGLLGFSAGGHLTASACTNFDKRFYESLDDVDKVSCRPDFAVLIYPAYLVTKEKDALLPEIRVTDKTPPMFLAHAGNDGVPAENSVELYRALKKAGVKAELHVFTSGGHGFGLRPTAEPSTSWPKRCEEWLRNQKWLPAAP